MEQRPLDPSFLSGVSDVAVDAVVAWFRARPDVEREFGEAIRQAFDEVFDGQRTGRYRIEELSKVEKTYIGTKIEIIVQDTFGLVRGRRMDYEILGHEVDAKWSMSFGGWMIPTEAVNQLCLCLTADDLRSTFSVGVVRATPEALKPGKNQDRKGSLSPAGIARTAWIVRDGPLPKNLLLHLDVRLRERVLSFGLSGQQRVNELFRSVQHRLVRREVVLTVAQQDDGPKRVRDARLHLRREGIVILGHQKEHPRIARGLGLDLPSKGSWISARITPTAAGGVEIGGDRWRLASADDPVAAVPPTY